MARQVTDDAKRDSASLVVYQLHIELQGIEPAIWRRLRVPSWITLAKLHQLLQVAMGWTNSHLHQFMIGGHLYGIPDDDWVEMSPRDERRAILADCLSERVRGFTYEYDFGDGWEHAISVESIVPADQVKRYPLCIGGANACPPEDVGGTSGYLEFVEAITNPKHPEHDEMLTWCGGAFDPAGFDLNVVNAALRRIKIPSRR